MITIKTGPTNLLQEEVDPPSTGRSISLEVLTISGPNATHYMHDIINKYEGRTHYHSVVLADALSKETVTMVLTYANTPSKARKDGGQISRRITRIANTYPWLIFTLRPYWND